MASGAIDDEEIALSINPSYTRRGSTKAAADPNGLADQTPRASAAAAAASQAADAAQNQRTRQERQAQKTTQQRLGQYQLLDTLGEGSFGKVKLAVHHITGQRVALKIISRRKLVARDMAGRVEREIQYLQLLRHPHIIKLFTVITTPGEIVMVLEYAGSELFNYIVDHGKMAEDKARMFFQQIVCAVEYCHRHKIVHRDLKPENLLLDENLHVKIADFGLSNIMTDGNFLKTSCGSPNYAAPEVISGKLYAGPEVDVWSCGVILYVLLVGRLPFDDEYIPALFKKIAQGNYHVPHYLSQGAVRLIKKMLQVSPVNRITVQEIRQDPWFVKDLPQYLQPPVEEFMDTGVDPNKAIDPRSLAPNKPSAVQEQIHEKVVGKLGKTMGYGREDVQQALAIDEPNAIKDAYLIVRENQIMKESPQVAADPAVQPFLAQSPPIHDAIASPTHSVDEVIHSPTSISGDRSRQNAAQAASLSEARSPINTVGVLPSSLPDYHKAYMEGQPHTSPPGSHGDGDIAHDPGHVQSPEQQAATARRLKPHSRSQLNLDRAVKPETMTPVQHPQRRTKVAKWQFGIRSRNQPAEAMLAIYKALKAMGGEWEVPKPRSPPHSTHRDDEGDSFSGSDEDSESDEDDDLRFNSREFSADEGAELTRQTADRNSNSTASSGTSPARGRRRRRLRSQYNSGNDWGYQVPSDPWIINARFRKDGMFPPGILHPSSTHSSRGDLVYSSDSIDGQPRSRRSSTLSSFGAPNHGAVGSMTDIHRTTSPTQIVTDNPSLTGPAPPQPSSGPPSNGPSSRPSSRKHSYAHTLSSGNTSSSQIGMGSMHSSIEADDNAYVYMTIQLYSIEKQFYVVDFKCAGYERLVRIPKGEKGPATADNGKKAASPEATTDSSHKTQADDESHEDLWEGEGRAAEEKDVSSPFPFLDVASRLIIQLAEAE